MNYIPPSSSSSSSRALGINILHYGFADITATLTVGVL